MSRQTAFYSRNEELIPHPVNIDVVPMFASRERKRLELRHDASCNPFPKELLPFAQRLVRNPVLNLVGKTRARNVRQLPGGGFPPKNRARMKETACLPENRE
jgi:hypothetical protein